MHLDLPFRIDSRGACATTDDEDAYVRDLVEQVLFTSPGERVNRPSFGSGVLGLVFEPGGGELATATEFVVQGALQQWLAELVEVHAVEVTGEDATLRVTVRYRPRRAAQPRTVVFTRPV
ncbi:GPW/gp25 family protein [Streptomyces sp. NPDC021093]|uniref:GPW/gp25 family protein n=1 Tax=Streptomyces sp. NPDC021093 TaxID=3365112 RepID=UPI0037AC4FA9